MAKELELSWAFDPFERLVPGDLYDVLALRSEIFVVEQHCAYQDLDGRDRVAWHLRGRDGHQGPLVTYARAVPPGDRFPGWSIGRVVVHGTARGRGLGRVVMREMMKRLEEVRTEPGPIWLAAQAHLEPFYASLGFVRCSEPYEEDAIPHVDMVRR